jgi:hypothetical protein
VSTDVSEELIASIFRVEQIGSANQRASNLPPAYLLVLADIFSTLKMEAISYSETSVETQQTTRRHIPENDTLQEVLCSIIVLDKYSFNSINSFFLPMLYACYVETKPFDYK